MNPDLFNSASAAAFAYIREGPSGLTSARCADPARRARLVTRDTKQTRGPFQITTRTTRTRRSGFEGPHTHEGTAILSAGSGSG